VRMRDRHLRTYDDLATVYFDPDSPERAAAYERLRARIMALQVREQVQSERSQRRASRQPRVRGRFVKREVWW
jgi:hypothetical protein